MGNLFLETGAEFDGAGDCYRYTLWRRWDTGPTVCWIMLNPSTADASVDDPTVRRCQRFARAWGYAGVTVVNLFALRSTDPAVLRRHPEPVGPGNNHAIVEAATAAALVVCAWGVHGAVNHREAEVLALLTHLDLYCLGVTAGGAPRHPLYLHGDSKPQRYFPPAGNGVDDGGAKAERRPAVLLPGLRAGV